MRSTSLAAALLLGGVPALPAAAQGAAAPVPEAPVARPAVRAVFGAGSVSLVTSGGRESIWTQASAGVALATSAHGTATFEVQRITRPGLANLRGALRHEAQLSDGTAVAFALSASEGDPLRERWGIGGGIARRIGAQVRLALDARAARYRTLDLAGRSTSFVGLAVNPGLVVTPRGTPLELTAQAIMLRNERKAWQFGAMLRAHYYTGDRDFLVAGVSRYPENELGRVRQLTSAHVGLRREIGGGIGMRATAEYARLQGAWEARTISIGLEKRF